MVNKNPFTFLLIIFIVSAFADIVLNDLTRTQLGRTSRIITSLIDYFKDKLVLESALYAGITIVVATVLLITITMQLFKFRVPTTFTELGLMMLVAYPLGFIADVAIEKLKIFGTSLDHYYRVAGAGHWGAIAFEVALISAFVVHQGLLPIL